MTDKDQYTILVIDDEENMRHMLSASLTRKGYAVVSADHGASGLTLLAEKRIDVILCDLKMPVMGGLEFLEELHKRKTPPLIIMMSAFATIDTAVQAMKKGAYDFITKPFKIDEILCVLEKATERLSLLAENRTLREKVASLELGHGPRPMVGNSPAIEELKALIRRVASYDTTVLITGESGTGKELVARGIHQLSERAAKPFISVNCGAVPANLLESEFFGYVKGAFSGAERDRHGLFREAEGGVLFLDEIGELPLALQVKLLRVLQEREIRPVGATVQSKIDVRVIAATAKTLQDEVDNGRFRQDLYYRLNVIGLHVPPLRERKTDLVLLCDHFLHKLAAQTKSPMKRLAPAVIEQLLRYDWPGNVRELENCLERAVILSTEATITVEAVAPIVRAAMVHESGSGYRGLSLKEGKIHLEKDLISRALAQTDYNKSRAAELLEISYPSLLGKIKEYGF